MVRSIGGQTDMDDFLEDRTFCQAAADVLGLPPDKLMLGVKVEPENGAMVLRASFAVGADDLARIGQRAKDLAGTGVQHLAPNGAENIVYPPGPL